MKLGAFCIRFYIYPFHRSSLIFLISSIRGQENGFLHWKPNSIIRILYQIVFAPLFQIFLLVESKLNSILTSYKIEQSVMYFILLGTILLHWINVGHLGIWKVPGSASLLRLWPTELECLKKSWSNSSNMNVRLTHFTVHLYQFLRERFSNIDRLTEQKPEGACLFMPTRRYQTWTG